MKMRGLIFVVLIFTCCTAYSQAVIHFEQSVHDFGTIKEVDGPVSYDFVFTNRGNAPIIIKNVESSCGCTSPEWTKQPILPGKTGYIKATFDPKDRPSFFDKTITVFSNARNARVELKIKGMVEGRTRTILDEYPYELASGLRLPLDHISLLTVKKGAVKTMTYGVYNNSGKKVVVSFRNLPAWLSVSIDQQSLEQGKIANIKASYNTAMHAEYGLNEETINLSVDGKEYPLRVSVMVEEDFEGVNPAMAPDIAADKKYYNFGISSSPVSFVYRVTNTGKSTLKIHRIYTNDERVSTEISVKELAPGESADLKAQVKEGAETGKLSCLISVISNSPLNPVLSLRFYGEIK